MCCKPMLRIVAISAALCTMSAIAPTTALATDTKIVIAAPGIPPIFASVILYVADKEGYFKKYGANVEIRPFDTGTAAARAVIAGVIDMAFSPSALVINQISNTGVGLVAIYGMINSDMVLASVDPSKTSCKDVIGQPVGVDTVGRRGTINRIAIDADRRMFCRNDQPGATGSVEFECRPRNDRR